jgi:hypothetical protein
VRDGQFKLEGESIQKGWGNRWLKFFHIGNRGEKGGLSKIQNTVFISRRNGMVKIPCMHLTI